LIDKEGFWHLICPGDTVLLSDRITHHYTIIVGVDRDKDEIEFGDPWPKQFFLLEGMNEAGVKARLVPNPRVTRDEFSRVVVGLVRQTTPDLAKKYLHIAPTAKSDRKTQLALGLTMLYAGDQFAGDAQGYFSEAVSLAEVAGDAEGKRFAASRLLLCVLLHRAQTVLRCRATTDGPQRQELFASLSAGQKIIDYLEEKHGFKQDWLAWGCKLPRDLLKGLSNGELVRLGLAAMAIDLYQVAVEHFSDVIQKSAKHEGAYICRARAKRFLQDYQGAVDDATVALQLIGSDRESGDRKRRNIQALTVRVMANHQLKRFEAAVADAKEIIEAEPEKTDGYVLAGNACLASGQLEAARDFFRQGLSQEKDPERRKTFLEEIGKLDRRNKKSD
jgi:tetratricopeptide (TPR) repeat protein